MFLLARFISARQPVVLCDSLRIYLFFRGDVYWRPTATGFYELPRHKQIEHCPVWTLIDMDYQDLNPPIERASNIWPIQTSSPNPVRWKLWQKQNEPSLLGMSLWNMEELKVGMSLVRSLLATDLGQPFNGGSSLTDLCLCSLRLQPRHDVFRGELDNRLSDEPAHPGNPGKALIDAVMEVLLAERKKGKCGGSGSGVGS